MLELQVIGNLFADAEVRSYNGNEFIAFSVASNKKWKDAAGVAHEETIAVDCTMSNTAIVPYLKKGQKVFLRGEFSVRAFTRKDGTNGAGVSCRVHTIELLGGVANATPVAPTPAAAPAEDNAPFPPMDAASQRIAEQLAAAAEIEPL